MDIGTGIAIAGVWVFSGMMGLSKSVSSAGIYFSVFISIIVTLMLKW